MAIAEVASQKATIRATPAAGTTADVVLPAAVAAGDFVVLVGACWNTTFPTVSTVAKQGGTATTATFAISQSSTGVSLAGGIGSSFLAYALVTGPGPLTLRLTLAVSGAYINACTDVFSGVNASPLDVNGGEAVVVVTGAAPAVDTITTLTANALLLGVHCLDAGTGTPITEGSGYTMLDEDETVARIAYSAQWKLATTATTYNVDWTCPSATGTITHSIVDAAFKPSAAAAVPQAAYHYAMQRGAR